MDAYALVEPYFGLKGTDKILRIMDIANGCGHQCNTCFADADRPTNMFTRESLEKLFSDRRFLNMLDPYSLRFGSQGDIADHPVAVDIVEMSLEETKLLDAKAYFDDRIHKVKVFTNYRKHREDVLDGLLELAQRNERLSIVISLPFNLRDNVHKSFRKYVDDRRDIFGSYNLDEHGIIDGRYMDVRGNVGIQDVRGNSSRFGLGRVIARDGADCLDCSDLSYGFEQRGFVKVFLNPDALWLSMYATIYEAHTSRLYTELPPSRIPLAMKLPWHPDEKFTTPPGWREGGLEKVYEGMYASIANGLRNHKPLRVIR